MTVKNGLYSIRIEMKDGARGRATGVIILLDGQILGGALGPICAYPIARLATHIDIAGVAAKRRWTLIREAALLNWRVSFFRPFRERRIRKRFESGLAVLGTIVAAWILGI
jgi:hypothetical protein